MENKMKTKIEQIGTYRLILNTGCHVDLEGCLYVPRCFRNLVYVAKLDELGFSFKIGNNVFFLFMDWIERNPCIICDTCVVAPEPSHQVLLGT